MATPLVSDSKSERALTNALNSGGCRWIRLVHQHQRSLFEILDESRDCEQYDLVTGTECLKESPCIDLERLALSKPRETLQVELIQLRI